ncbi:hypothetical protein RBSWK_00968 [Rhodopirellula baltica SWK14]|uniref:Uncharacterized protein n=1 Tax=Rhodopirellula baltica SWK14 TaxID=993516 RepID=L7CM02_RHOBT|nr:hypothetical protein RBSWK_00968 [Rhodopirellula baltica SWK14]
MDRVSWQNRIGDGYRKKLDGGLTSAICIAAASASVLSSFSRMPHEHNQSRVRNRSC